MKDSTLSEPSTDEVLATLKKRGFAIVKASCDERQTCKKVVDRLSAIVLELVGEEINGSHIKLSGHWVNMDLTSGALSYYYMLRVI
jgi:hypothetical protein